MKYKAIFDNSSNVVTISSGEAQSAIVLKINLGNNEVQQIYDFFKHITVQSILSESQEISFDYEEIKKEDFYTEESFQKLLELFSDLLDIANETLRFVNDEEMSEERSDAKIQESEDYNAPLPF